MTEPDTPATVPEQSDVDALRDLLDLMEKFESNDERARYLLSSEWMRDRGPYLEFRPRAYLAKPAGEVLRAAEQRRGS